MITFDSIECVSKERYMRLGNGCYQTGGKGLVPKSRVVASANYSFKQENFTIF